MSITYALIPVRGGSKGLPRKNIRLLDGLPLVAYSIRAAQQAERVTRVFVSTEDQEIADVAARHGAEILFRPDELANDTAGSNEVVMHCCGQWEEQGTPPDVVVYLQATDIFRSRGIIDATVDALLRDASLDAVFAAMPDHKNYWAELPDGLMKMNRFPEAPRQSKIPLYREDTGIACATRFATARTRGRLGERNGLVAHDDHFTFIDIHTEEDLWLAETVVQHFKGTDRYAF
jgi:CMP-N-acetylneuraminic acid synthetase